MKAINLVLWAAGLGLQGGLVGILFWRRVYRRFPIFTCLIVYYLIRSVSTYILSLFGVAVQQEGVGDVFSALDLTLQILLVIELAMRSSNAPRRGKWPQWSRTALQLAAEGAIAAGISWLIPEPVRVPLDRGVIFVTVLMILRFVWSLRNRQTGAVRIISGGFALYGVVVMAAGAMENLAVAARNSSEFLVASYAPALVYIGVVLLWVVTLRRAPTQRRMASARS